MLSDESSNPYAPPSFSTTASKPVTHDHEEELADRGTRLIASILDGVLLIVVLFGVMVPFLFLLMATNEDWLPSFTDWEESLLGTLYVYFIFVLVNGYLLYDRGQTVGKYIMKIQVVDQVTSELLPFWRVCILRHMWALPISLIALFVADPVLADKVVNSLSMIDALFIFSAGKLCMHDRFAFSRVVRFKPDRPRIS